MEAAAELGGIGVQADITDPADVTRLFDAAERVDVLVNNAGIITISKLEELTLDDWDRVLRVNTTGAFLCCQAAAAQHARAGRRRPDPQRRLRAGAPGLHLHPALRRLASSAWSG